MHEHELRCHFIWLLLRTRLYDSCLCAAPSPSPMLLIVVGTFTTVFQFQHPFRLDLGPYSLRICPGKSTLPSARMDIIPRLLRSCVSRMCGHGDNTSTPCCRRKTLHQTKMPPSFNSSTVYFSFLSVSSSRRVFYASSPPSSRSDLSLLWPFFDP